MTQEQNTSQRQGSETELEIWHVRIPSVRSVPPEQAWSWLRRGWQDYERTWQYGIVFGLFYALAGAAVLTVILYLQSFHLLFPLTAGFLLIGPVTAVGLYEISRRLETGEEVRQDAVFGAFARHGGKQIALMGVALTILMILWMKIAMLLFALFYGLHEFTPDELLDTMLASPNTIPFLVIGNLFGAVLAGAAFSISAVSIPFLLHKDADVMTAMITSIKACARNPMTMAIWGAIIVGTMAISVVTAFTGLAVILPVIGHASWHAYRDLVELDL